MTIAATASEAVDTFNKFVSERVKRIIRTFASKHRLALT